MKRIERKHTSDELTALSRSSENGTVSHRILAIRDVLSGDKRGDVCDRYGITRETLRHWVRWYDEEGLDGLRDGVRTGRRPKLPPEAEASLRERLSSPPDPERDGICRWRAVDIQRILKEEHGVELKSLWSVCRLCRRLGLSWITGRPSHPKRDAEAVETFKKT